MILTYVGPHDAADLEGFGSVAHGSDTPDLPAALAKRLLDQPDNWKKRGA